MQAEDFEVDDIDDKSIIKIEPEEIWENETELDLNLESSDNLVSNLKLPACSSQIELDDLDSRFRPSRLASKTLATSKVNNIYAKPRMHFTGKGVVKKIQPGSSFILKKKRGRKPKLKNRISIEKADVETPLLKSNPEIIVDIDSPVQNTTREIKVVVEVNNTSESENYFYIKKKRDRRFAKVPNVDTSPVHPTYYEGGNNPNQTEVSINENDDQFSDNFPKVDDGCVNRFVNKKIFKRVGHRSEGLVECTICFKRMKDTSMKQHFKTHSGAKPFPCTYCGARFTRKGDVDRHRKAIHRNVKPFECSMCERRFVERKVLISHLQNHDRMLYYTCTTCGFKFGKREYYQNHVRFIHPLEEGQSLTEVKDIYEKGLKQLDKLLLEEKEAAKLGKKSISFFDENVDNIKDEVALNIKLEEATEEYNENSPDESQMDPLILESTLNQEDLDDDDDGESSQKSEATPVDLVSLDDVSVVKGTLSMSQTVGHSPKSLEVQEEEQLVNKAIHAAIFQAEVVLENIQLTIGSNMASSKPLPSKLPKQTTFKEIKASDKLTKPIQPKSSEIHINATVGGILRKFLIQMPSGSSIDATTEEGMDTLVNMVNYLCSGKGELNGPVEVIMHHTV